MRLPLCIALVLANAGLAVAQQPMKPEPPLEVSTLAQVSEPETGSSRGSTDTDGRPASEQDRGGEAAASAISGNPGATNITIGTGWLGRTLGFDRESGVYLGGAWIGNANWQMSGGRRP